MKPFFDVHFGKKFRETRTLIMSESTYDWRDKTGTWKTAESDCPKWSVLDGASSGKPAYIQAVSRALCNKRKPSTAEASAAWERFAYWIYVQETVGKTWLKRPSRDHWKRARETFVEMIEEERPEKIIVTGLQMWAQMPDCDVMIHRDLQGYVLKDGKTIVWCLAVPHPSSRKPRYKWKEVALQIEAFTASALPSLSNRLKFRLSR